MFNKILVAIDQSDMGKHVFDEALSLAKATDAELMLLHVLSPFDEQYPTAVGLQADGIYPTFRAEDIDYSLGHWDTLKQEGIEFLTLLNNQAIAQNVTVDFTQELGDPSRLICEFARVWKADLIVIGRRGRSGFSEFILGSVSNYVLHHAPCSVLTVQGVIHSPVIEVPEAQAASA
jgi:nucleotide-binding universal stress UspA family protein